jgi:hypothetical protein
MFPLSQFLGRGTGELKKDFLSGLQPWFPYGWGFSLSDATGHSNSHQFHIPRYRIKCLGVRMEVVRKWLLLAGLTGGILLTAAWMLFLAYLASRFLS